MGKILTPIGVKRKWKNVKRLNRLYIYLDNFDIPKTVDFRLKQDKELIKKIRKHDRELRLNLLSLMRRIDKD